jgi:hypothetical protein
MLVGISSTEFQTDESKFEEKNEWFEKQQDFLEIFKEL